MSVVQKDYVVFLLRREIEKGEVNLIKTLRLPPWFILADKYKKIIRVLGATAGYESQQYLRLFSNISDDSLSRGFIMMINNYNNVKEFNVSNSNLTDLTFAVLTPQWNDIIDDINLFLVVELELLLIDDN
jgi:hypothetical protein